MNGTVTISLADYDALRADQKKLSSIRDHGSVTEEFAKRLLNHVYLVTRQRVPHGQLSDEQAHRIIKQFVDEEVNALLIDRNR